MRQLDQEYVDLAKLMGVKGWKLTFKVIFPAISPYVFTGIRTSIPFAVIGAIVGEFIAATEGLGFFIRLSAGIFKTADVFVGIIVLMIMVIVMDKIAELVERRALRWQTQTEHVQIQARCCVSSLGSRVSSSLGNPDQETRKRPSTCPPICFENSSLFLA